MASVNEASVLMDFHMKWVVVRRQREASDVFGAQLRVPSCSQRFQNCNCGEDEGMALKQVKTNMYAPGQDCFKLAIARRRQEACDCLCADCCVQHPVEESCGAAYHLATLSTFTLND